MHVQLFVYDDVFICVHACVSYIAALVRSGWNMCGLVGSVASRSYKGTCTVFTFE